MPPHLSAQELGFLLGRLPLPLPAPALGRETAALAAGVGRPAAPPDPRPDWPPGVPPPARSSGG